MKDTYLADVVGGYQIWRRSRGIAENTIRRDEATLKQLVVVAGKIKPASLSHNHIDDFFLSRRHLAESTQNMDLATLRTFFGYLDSRGYHRKAKSLLQDYRPIRYALDPRRRIAIGEFPALLDAATRPRDRIVIALGLYLFLRSSEIKLLRIKDVNLATDEVSVKVVKTRDSDVMPISSELAKELRSWLTYYTEQVGPLNPEWFLVPNAQSGDWERDDMGRVTKSRVFIYNPERPLATPERTVQKVLKRFGWTVVLKEGVHTLRRSGARALYDELAASDGHSNALETVSAMMHHRNMSTTQHYLGLTETRRKRDGLIRGKTMFPSLEGVSSLPTVSLWQDEGNG